MFANNYLILSVELKKGEELENNVHSSLNFLMFRVSKKH